MAHILPYGLKRGSNRRANPIPVHNKLLLYPLNPLSLGLQISASDTVIAYMPSAQLLAMMSHNLEMD